MAHYYDCAYRLSSDAVHTLPMVLTEFAGTDEEGYIMGLKYGPSDKDAKINLMLLAEFMYIALVEMLQPYELDEKDKMDSFAGRYLALKNEINKPFAWGAPSNNSPNLLNYPHGPLPSIRGQGGRACCADGGAWAARA